jgi:UDP-glucuronate 4-epimerase
MRLLVTGSAGFIGFHTARRLLDRGDEVFGLDNLNDYYDVRLKRARLAQLEGRPGFSFAHVDIEDEPALRAAFDGARPERVVHLAAQAGVRYSLVNPKAYVDSNLVGFANVLELCREHETSHLVFASSSSVYGANTDVPFSAQGGADHPVSLYAATKKANELMAHAYAHLYDLPCTGLRFFTVYGPFGRPDMAYYSFAEAILDGRPIDVFNNGGMRRDFTYVDDIVDGVVAALDRIPQKDSRFAASGPFPDPSRSAAPYRLYNLGNDRPVELSRFISILEEKLGLFAQIRYLPMQPGDVLETHADIADATRELGFRPKVALEEGLSRFADWLNDWRCGEPRNC